MPYIFQDYNNISINSINFYVKFARIFFINNTSNVNCYELNNAIQKEVIKFYYLNISFIVFSAH